MTYSIRRATKDDIADLVQQTLDMAIETEDRVLDGAALGKGMAITFERPNLADYYVVVHQPADAEGDSGVDVASPTGVSDSDGDRSSPNALGGHFQDRVAAKSSSQVAGFMMTTKNFKVRTATTVQLIQTVYVAPAHRRHGLFRRFYEHIKAEVVADDTCEGIWLYVEEENTSAIAAYQRMGMTREDKHMMRWSKCGF